MLLPFPQEPTVFSDVLIMCVEIIANEITPTDFPKIIAQPDYLFIKMLKKTKWDTVNKCFNIFMVILMVDGNFM